MKEMTRNLAPVVLSILLLIEWGCVYFIGGILGEMSLKGLYIGSLVGTVLVMVMGLKFLIDLFKNRKLNSIDVVLLIIGIVMAYPNLNIM